MNEAPAPQDAAQKGGYDPAFFGHLAQIEDKHFWFRARNQLILELTRRISSSLHPCNFVLEVGCGTGNVVRFLERALPKSTVIGMELWSESRVRRRFSDPVHGDSFSFDVELSQTEQNGEKVEIGQGISERRVSNYSCGELDHEAALGRSELGFPRALLADRNFTACGGPKTRVA